MSPSPNQHPLVDEGVMPPFSEHWALRRRINQKLKQLALQQVTRSTSLEALETLDNQLAQAVGTLANEGKELLGRESWFKDAEGHHGSYWVLSREIAPIAGQSNAVAPPMHIWFDTNAKKSYGKVTLNWLYEGPPFCAHGGIVAALFDDFLGCTQLLNGATGATGILNLRYHLPTPLNTELQFEGEIKSTEGRKVTISGVMFANKKKIVSAEGLFITVPEGIDNLSKGERVFS